VLCAESHRPYCSNNFWRWDEIGLRIIQLALALATAMAMAMAMAVARAMVKDDGTALARLSLKV